MDLNGETISTNGERSCRSFAARKEKKDHACAFHARSEFSIFDSPENLWKFLRESSRFAVNACPGHVGTRAKCARNRRNCGEFKINRAHGDRDNNNSSVRPSSKQG